MKYQLLVTAGTVTWTKRHCAHQHCHPHKTHRITENFHTLIWLHFIWRSIKGTPSHIFIYPCLFVSPFLSLSFLYKDTQTVLSASLHPLYKRSLFKGSMSGRIGLGSLPEAYQWRQSTLMLLLYAVISTNRMEGKVETNRQTKQETVKLRKTGRWRGEVWRAYTNYKSVLWKKKRMSTRRKTSVSIHLNGVWLDGTQFENYKSVYKKSFTLFRCSF